MGWNGVQEVAPSGTAWHTWGTCMCGKLLEPGRDIARLGAKLEQEVRMVGIVKVQVVNWVAARHRTWRRDWMRCKALYSSGQTQGRSF